MSEDVFIVFLTGTLVVAADRCRDGAIAFVCMDWRHMGELLSAGRTLMAESDVPADCTAIIDGLLARKAETREMGHGRMPRQIGALIDAEFGLGRVQMAGAGETFAA